MNRLTTNLMSLLRRSGALVGLAVLLLADAAWAGGFHISIIGVRRNAMMANLARPDDVTALFHNPAGLADQKGLRLHLSNGMTFLNTSVSLQQLDPVRFPEVDTTKWTVGSDGYYEDNIKPERYLGIIPFLGASQDLGFVSPALKDVVVAAAAYAPNAYGAFLPKDAPTAYYVEQGLFLVASATSGVGWRPNKHFAVGANLSYNYMQLGYSQKFSAVDLLTPLGQQPDFMADAAQRAVGDLDLEYNGKDQGLGWALSALIDPVDWATIGLTYSGATSAFFKGDVTISSLGSDRYGTKPLSDSDFSRLLHSFGVKMPKQLEVEMPIPPAVSAGVTVHPTSRVEVGVDLRLWLYSVFEKQIMRPLYDQAETGSEPMTEAQLSKDKDYSNSYEIALGGLIRPFENENIELMAGIGFDKSPVPDKSFSIDNPSLNQLVLSAGARALLAEHWRLGFAYMMINYIERDVRTSQTSPPTNVVVSARSHIPTVEAEYIF